MATYEFDNRASLADKREVVVNGNRYHQATSMLCATCARDDRFLYVKQRLDNDIMLECPYCYTITPTKKSLVIGLD